MVTLALHKEEYDSLSAELAAVQLPHGTMIHIPGAYIRKMIMKRCEGHRDLYSSRKFQEKRIPTIPMSREAACGEIKDSIRWWWSLPLQKRAELEARYQGLT